MKRNYFFLRGENGKIIEMRRTSEEEKKAREESDEDEEDSDTASVASTKFSYYSINSTCSEKSRKQARLSNYTFCIQVSSCFVVRGFGAHREGVGKC